MSKSAQILPVFYFLVDLLVLVVAFLASTYMFNQHDYQGQQWTILTFLVMMWLVIGYSSKLYKLNLHNGFVPRLVSYSKSYFLYVVVVIGMIYLLMEFPSWTTNVFLTFVIGFLALDIIANAIIINLISTLRRTRENISYALVAGTGEVAQNISHYFNSNPDYGYEIKGYLKCKGEVPRINENKIVGTLNDMKEYLTTNRVDEIVIALPYRSYKNSIRRIINEADFHGIRVSFVPDYAGLLGNQYKIINDSELNAVNVRQLPLDEIYPAIEKATFDKIFSAIVLILLAPVFLAIAALIKLDSPGPVFYCPTRVGRRGKNFKVYKFRTMRENDSATGGTMSTQINDPRITRVGRILRKYNLDELPQFFNVLNGTMSVVGPRPHRNFLNEQMKAHVDKYMLRHYFRPGITGWAQVNGWRGPTETEEQIKERTAHDLWYIENWSFMLDMKIIWLTIFGRKTRLNAF